MNSNIVNPNIINPLVPEEPMDVDISDLRTIFDPACNNFAGSAGDCERAKLRIESIYTRCLAAGRSKIECQKAKITEAERIANEQLTKESKRKYFIKHEETIRAKKDFSKCKENAKGKGCGHKFQK